ncbi:hypothetical protein GGP66_000015 [Salinibacter ruber]|uniref:Uncharacterized protein n=1 Tax=Salinibacter ruber TaxID=146919 RepID=A0A9X2ZDL8_9BACT|nr:hypothetical protein [Salinibacter ruber]MCS3612752.1 hypothetical protein [Salinibacter ruber]MCS3616209.1 hypothetical protein [Salinibacter ruber]MCS3648628.1 hypothetical protein [Salinibacter ruber]MCS3672611.1 hypothetical protein [Salinibacter ruber]
MMMLVAFASAVAYAYSAAVALAVPGQMVFWKPAPLTDPTGRFQSFRSDQSRFESWTEGGRRATMSP